MKMIFKYLKPYILFAILAPLTMCGEVIMDLFQPDLMSSIIDKGLGLGNYSLIIQYGLLMLGLVILGGICGFSSAGFASAASQSFADDLRKDCFKKIMNLSFEQTDNFTTGSLVTRMTDDITMIQQLVSSFIRMFVRTIMLFIGGIIFLMKIKLEFGYFLLFALPFEIICIIIVLKIVLPSYKKIQEQTDKLNSIMQENVSGSRVVKAYVREEYEGERFNKANINLSKTMLKVQNIVAFLMPVMSILMNLVVIGIILMGGISVRLPNSDMEVGQVMASISYVAQILMAVASFAMMFQTVTRGKASIDRVNEILKTEPVIKSGEFKIENIEGRVEFKNVSFKYPNSSGDPIIKNLTLDVKPGNTLAILGATGSGKTSIVNLVSRFYDVTDGELLIDNVNVKEYDLTNLRSKIGVVFQKTELFTGTIEENIRWGNPDATLDEIKKACKIAQADEFIEEFSDGYQTMISSKGTSLSGGQKQRIAIARAILKKPNILIFDDATSALDLATEAKLYKALKENLSQVTILLVAQRVASVTGANQIAVIDNGMLSALGTNEELLKTSKLYQDIYNSQLKIEGSKL